MRTLPSATSRCERDPVELQPVLLGAREHRPSPLELPGGGMLLILAAFAPAEVAAEPVAAEQAMANYRSVFGTARLLECPPATTADQIVVCGRRREQGDPNRLPLPVEPDPGGRTRLIAGEPPRAVPGLRLGRQSCSTDGPNQQCSGGLPVFQVIFVVKKAVEALVDLTSDLKTKVRGPGRREKCRHDPDQPPACGSV